MGTDRFARGGVRVVLELDGAEHNLGYRAFVYGAEDDPTTVARPLLDAWDEARTQAERTLRLYGAETIFARLATPALSQEED